MNHRYYWGPVVLLILWLVACGGGRQSTMEGKLVNWNDKPVPGVKITAVQVQPIKGYEQFEAVTNTDGTFRIKGLFPSSAYVLKPWSDKWICKTEVKIDTAPRGETSVLREPMKINQAFSKSTGSLVIDLATGATRFTVSSEGIISDSNTGLEWFVGPDDCFINYTKAKQWVTSCNTGGGGWRMPGLDELNTLYQKGLGKHNMDPAFNTTGWFVTVENGLSNQAIGFSFYYGPGKMRLYDRTGANIRVFAVRSCPIVKIEESVKPQPETLKAKDPASNLKISTFDITSKFLNNDKIGKIFIIAGQVKNKYPDVRNFIRVTGKLYMKRKILIQAQTVFCGNVLSDIELLSLDPLVMKKRLLNRDGDNKSNIGVKPGQELPFMIVFSNPSNNVIEFVVDGAGSIPG